MMNVSVRTLKGSCIKLVIDNQMTVIGLKKQIQTMSGIPHLCQVLLHGTSVLRDAESVVDCVHEPSKLALSLMVSLDKVRQQCIGGRRCERVAALQAIGQLGTQCDSEAAVTVAQALKDRDESVRSVAYETLLQVCKKGDQMVIEKLRDLGKHPMISVRVMALRALPLLSEHGDHSAIEAAVYVSTNRIVSITREYEIQRCAVATMSALSVASDSRSIACVARLMRAEYWRCIGYSAQEQEFDFMWGLLDNEVKCHLSGVVHAAFSNGFDDAVQDDLFECLLAMITNGDYDAILSWSKCFREGSHQEVLESLANWRTGSVLRLPQGSPDDALSLASHVQVWFD
eukprot:TRINITY_DN2154_c0_g2_i1.p1 TRINITY_DN2154_c0_g2~~TRINITY_DN2154_c0_g2_i1.p1  ORF type:complete len:343 (-),score=28.43 TRINITY_DN2154_c0_g2_i1:58-1086(-)